MRELLKFLIFIIYSTVVFFVPNNELVYIPFCINILLIIACIIFTYIYEKHTHRFNKYKISNIFYTTFKVFPFILFTFIINCFLYNYINAYFVGLKLLIVCNVTVIYAFTTNTLKTAKTIALLCSPLKVFRVNTDEILVLVCIALSMIPILKSQLNEIRNSCKAKNMPLNIKNSKYIFSKFFLSLLMRVNEIEESLIAKGYNF